ncbi:MAG: CobN component of cobalt chelatase involved in B12 biosynthesis, partial [uncultured Lysobacter sp.]
MRAWRRWVAGAALALGLSGTASAGTVLGVVSERAAPEVAEAAAELARSRPSDRIVLRTPQQLAELDSRGLRALLAGSDAVIAVAVFGEQGVRLRETTQALRREQRGPAALYAFHSETELARGSYRGTDSLQVFSAAEIAALTADAPTPPALATRAEAQPFARDWLALRALWREGGQDNLRDALRWLLDGGAVPTPIA